MQFMPFVVFGLVFVLFSGKTLGGSSGGSSRGGSQITDEQLIQMGQQRGLFK